MGDNLERDYLLERNDTRGTIENIVYFPYLLNHLKIFQGS